MARTQNPELRKYMDKKLLLQVNGDRKVTGILRGYDAFMNLVLDEAKDETNSESLGMIVIRGNSISVMEIVA